ncbi:hypothetical protein FB446DRAFT_364814 [Lentinula raphanica]|nr:hypothetical protein FB446DRAFT_364814 [Lentinula raphanica]
MVDNRARSPSHPKALSIGDLPAEEEVARESQQSSSQESPFAGHAEEEDIILSPQEDSLELPRDPSSQPEAHQNDGAHGFEGGLESHVLGGSDAGDFSSAITALHEESLLEMDEQAFDEAHGDHAAVNGKNEESQVKNVQTSSNEVKALPGPATNVVQRAAAALSSLKERLSGSNSDYTSSGHGDVSVSPVSETRVKQLEDQLLSIKNNVASLNLKSGKYKTRFNDNAGAMNVKLARLDTLTSQLQDRLESLNNSSAKATDDAKGIRHDVGKVFNDIETVKSDVAQMQLETDDNRMDIDGVQIAVEGIRDELEIVRGDVNVLQDDVRGATTGFENEMSELRNDIEAVRSGFNDIREDMDDLMGGHSLTETVEDMQEDLQRLQQEWVRWKEDSPSIDKLLKAQEQNTAELMALRSARSQVETELQTISALRQRMEEAERQSTTRSSLKRKHADDDSEQADSGEDSGNSGVMGDFNSASSSEHAPSTTSSSNAHDILVPCSKRARRPTRVRRIGTVVAQTATVATVGAVAAWAALAFS